jgi:hypothetical protein
MERVGLGNQKTGSRDADEGSRLIRIVGGAHASNNAKHGAAYFDAVQRGASPPLCQFLHT